MTDAYIHWKYHEQPTITTFSDPSAVPTVDGWDFDIEILDIHSLDCVAVIPRDSETSIAVALVKAGYLGTTPINPSIAIALRTLELFYTLRLFKASLSVEAFTKTLCHIRRIPYRRAYRTNVSDAFDIYLTLRRKVDARVSKELGQDTPNYRVLHSCPPCNYKLSGETPLIFKRMFVVDGNNSLKRLKSIGNRQVADKREFNDSDYYLSTTFVNRFSEEVTKTKSTKSTTGQTSLNVPVEDEQDDDNDWVDVEGDPTDGVTPDDDLAHCTDNWKASSADSNKRMWGGFQESGIFASACRHGFILWICDMICSGELAKYPLAIVAKALEVYHTNWLMGYDIGCSFACTIARSSLGAEFKTKRCRTSVNAFHGYSHNAKCQQSNHPNNITGMGLEDLETLERIFSASNQLASVTRYMSAYRRRVFIDLFFQQWDRDKYQSLATFLHNNYIQALQIINEDASRLQAELQKLDLTEDDIEAYWKEQKEHFDSLEEENNQDLQAMEYVSLLQKLQGLNKSLEAGNFNLATQTPADYAFVNASSSYSTNLSETRRIETKRKYLQEERNTILFKVAQMETVLDIHRRWEPQDAEYRKALKYMNKQTYREALLRLHRLVVQRLWELHKMNLSQTGYKMRTQIAAALQKRSKAIRGAVAKYNNAALNLEPPRPTVDWVKVSHYSFLDQFDILADTRYSMMEKPWAKPVIWELMMQVRRVSRAREEILRLNVELRRLHTSIVDEEQHFDVVLQRLESSGSPLHSPVLEYVQRRMGVNKLLLARIRNTYALPGFTGTPYAGTRESSIASDITPPSHDPAVSSNAVSSNVLPSTIHSATHETNAENQRSISHAEDSDNDGAEEDDDELVSYVSALTDYITNVTT
ncbi:hypothetical protein F5878DRAFT_545718 [Lentinula raphanica]|uniref:CxC1-like cysteine cluster associated with KDZ transposases domain-containing protein n=1 Tax=Lentinula raphanica TaxID=153919 RepID=A0AA38U7S7_9AGAR|nr:hypothetical protein F5878DRAFT_545718 [Lentinula raphanica]